MTRSVPKGVLFLAPLASSAALFSGCAALLSGCAALGPKDDPAPIVRGPIRSRTQAPIKLTFLAFRPRSTETQAPDTLSLAFDSAYTRLFQNGHLPGADVVFDGELWRNSCALRWGLGERTDLEFEIGVLYAANGFLDRIVQNYHQFFGFPNGGQEERPLFAYEMDVHKNGQEIYHLDAYEPGLTDLPIVLTQRIVDETAGTPAIALRAGIELPTGSSSRGFGNGGIDWGAGVLLEKSLGRWTFTGAVDGVRTASPPSFAGSGVHAHDDLDLQLSSEFRWSDSVSLVGGIVLTSPVTRDIAMREIDREILSADAGIVWDVGPNTRFYAAFEDDVIAASGPDFSLLFGMTFGL